MTANINVTANFALDEYTLTVNTTGNGSVDKNPDQATYHYGDVVVLTATTTRAGRSRAGAGTWAGRIPRRTSVMDGNKTVTATFWLTIRLDGQRGRDGAVSVDPTR